MTKWINIKVGNCNPEAKVEIKKAKHGHDVVIIIPFVSEWAAEGTLKEIEKEGRIEQ